MTTLPPWSDLAGRIEFKVIDSVALKGNPLGDPESRPVVVYLPPGYDTAPDRRYPSVYVIQGYTGQVGMWFNRDPFRQPYPELVDALFRNDEAPPVIVVFVDAWTSYGGSQYLDSPATGRYHTYLCEDVVPWVDEHYRTVPDRDHRAITGKSSGGYGAMITPMLRPDLFGALATHAGDALFDVCYRTQFPYLARLLRDHYDGSYLNFLDDFGQRIAGTREGDLLLIEVYGYSAAYSPGSDGVPQVPFDVHGSVLPDIWSQWQEWDPVEMATRAHNAEALRSMRGIWIDAGSRDEWYLDLGALAFRQAVQTAGVPDERVHFELFDATHGRIEYRYPLALSWLAHRLSE